MNRAVIGIGSNIKPEENVAKAREIIAQNHQVLAVSRFIETKPIGYTDQPNFVNGAMLIETVMNRMELKQWLHEVEIQLGRVRTENKYGPRTIDLDIVVWNGEIVDQDVHERDFLRDAVVEVLHGLR